MRYAAWWMLLPALPAAAAGEGANCYSQADPDLIALWAGAAPGALGDDACRDIPYLRIFRAAGDGAGRAPAMLLIPGGGYDRLSNVREQAPVARYFARQLHVTTFILYYRLARRDGAGYRYPVPMWDGQRAVKLLRARADQYGIDPARIGVFGFSAGGHLASMLANHADDDFGLPRRDAVDDASGRPDLLALGYPVISMDPAQYASPSSHKHLLQGYRGDELARLENYLSAQKTVTARTPPVFLFESLDDQRISAQNSVLFAAALTAAAVPAQVQLFRHGVHGAGLAEDVPEESAWPALFATWLTARQFLRQPGRNP